MAQTDSGEATPTLPGYEEVEDQQIVPGASFAAETTLENFEQRSGVSGSAAQQPPEGAPELTKTQSFQ